MIINGKEYPLWSQFVERKKEYIGGLLQDIGGMFDELGIDEGIEETEIVDIELRPNGTDSAMFYVKGKEFGCGFDCGSGGIVHGEVGWVTFEGYGGHTWRIKPLNK